MKKAWQRKMAQISTPAMGLSSLMILAGAGSAIAHTSNVEVPTNLPTRALGRVSDSGARPPPHPFLSLIVRDTQISWLDALLVRRLPGMNAFESLTGVYLSWNYKHYR